MPLWMMSLALLFAGALGTQCLRKGFLSKGWPLLCMALAFGVLGLESLNLLGSQVQNTWSFPWYPSLGASFDFILTPFRSFMGLIVTGIGVAIVSYSNGYFHDDKKRLRFQAFLMLFSMAMLGVVLSDNLILLFSFWELTSVLSFLLVGFYFDKKESRDSALQALLITGGGGLALLGGFVLLGETVGTYRLSEMSNLDSAWTAGPNYPYIFALIALGAFTKSAQFPFHFWLPGAMAAPAPASAYLHSATMVKAGVFLMALFAPILGGTSLWTITLVLFGGTTFCIGAINSIFRSDLKAILANTTFAVLGLLMLLIGFNTEKTLLAMVMFLCAHALYKASLFMVAGIVDHECGTRSLALLGGLRKKMPFTAMGAILAALSMAGLPIFFGFPAKEYTYKALLYLEGYPWLSLLAIILAVLGSALMLFSAYQTGIRPFFGPSKTDLCPKSPHEAPAWMLVGPIGCGFLSVLLGCWPQGIGAGLGLIVQELSPKALTPEISLWHGFNLPLLLSAITVTLGFSLCFFRKYIPVIAPHSDFEALYNASLKMILALARTLAYRFQFHSLRASLLVVVISTGALLVWKIIAYGGIPKPSAFGLGDPLVVVLCSCCAIGAIAAAWSSTALSSLLAMGACGFSTAMIFLYYGAPDLSITQLAVDGLITVLFMGVASSLPKFPTPRLRQRHFDLYIAIGFGLIFTLLTLLAADLQLANSISEKFGQWSKVQGMGSNVVNVILVDFRALDTLGEVTVLAIAALGVLVLTQRKQKNKTVADTLKDDTSVLQDRPSQGASLER
jgi:multicomponent Na+:H+ antiporter subunit A